MSAPDGGRPLRLLAVSSHPIQYQAPWFRALAQQPELDFEVAYLDAPDPVAQGVGFGVPFQWDLPLLDGYRARFLPIRQTVRAGKWLRLSVRGARSQLRALRPDVLLVNGWHRAALVQTLVAARSLGIPILLRGEANALRPRRPLVRALHRGLLGMADAFLPIGSASHAFYRGYGIAEERLFDAPYFVDNERFASMAAPRRREMGQLRADFDLPVDAFVATFAGKFERKKHPDHFLRAMDAARKRVPGRALVALMVGAGAMEAQLRDLARTLGIEARFTGFMNQLQIPLAYAASDVLVLPSDHGETWGLVVNEAMACGVPAIVSDQVGCCADLIDQDATGASYRFGHLEGLSARIAQFANDAAACKRMGVAAQALVRDRFSVERAVTVTVAAARSVYAARRQAS